MNVISGVHAHGGKRVRRVVDDSDDADDAGGNEGQKQDHSVFDTRKAGGRKRVRATVGVSDDAGGNEGQEQRQAASQNNHGWLGQVFCHNAVPFNCHLV